MSIAIDFAGLRCASPIWTASGTFGYAQEFSQHLDLTRLGAVVTKATLADAFAVALRRSGLAVTPVPRGRQALEA